MEKITLKLFEFYNLDVELNGVVDPKTGQKSSNGLIGEKLPLTTKYWLTKLAKTVAEEKAILEELKNDLIKKYGTDDGSGNISIPMVIDELDADGKPIPADVGQDGKASYRKVINPSFQQFEKEFGELLQTQKEISYQTFKLSDFEKVETSDNYATFFQFLKVEDAPAMPS